MKIKNLKINGFGKLENKEIEFNDNINIICGENESGKSTLLKFIPGILYGLDRNKSGKDIPDYESYTPWQAKEFSGTLEYELDDKETYKIFRAFNKRGVKLLNKEGEDIASNFSVNKNKENEFFYEQTKITEQIFMNTVVSEQEKVKVEKEEQNILIQKITNFIETGDDNISFNKAKDILNKRAVTEIGTDRTNGRPINIVNENLKKIESEIIELEQYKEKQEIQEKIKDELEKQIEEQNKKIIALNIEKEKKEKEKIEKEKLKIQEQYSEDYKRKDIKKKFSHAKYLIFLGIFILFNIAFILNKNISMMSVGLSILLINIGVYVVAYKRFKNKIEDLKKLNEKVEKRKLERLKQLEEEEKMLDEEHLKIINTLSMEQSVYNNLNLELHKLKLEQESILPKLENLALKVEEKENLEEEKEELKSLENSINTAILGMQRAYEKMKLGILPKFTESLGKIIEKTTNGEYKDLRVTEEGLIITLQNGDNINANRLSVGTIYQIYLGLRIAFLQAITEEKMPIILDEPFVYFDENRLENMLKYMEKELKEHQILIFTCSNREIDALNKEKIQYNLIKM